jgi:prepilin-type N-terminal cleavage/methylation domain-containing protein
MRQMKNNILNQGFTLIEVLLVITLMGILLTIGLVNFNSEARFIDTRNDIRKTHIRTLESAITQYRLQNGSYPAGLTRDYQEICDPDATSCTGFIDLTSSLVPDFLQAIPRDPNDTDNTGGSGYEIAVDEDTNIVSVRALKAETNVEIKINDILPAEPTATSSNPLAETVPNEPTLSCPTGYIKVPGNSLYGTNDFCVMKYEAKTGSGTVAATTQAAGAPQVSITQANAITACSLNGPGYGLISNSEWMTIARNIEGQPTNWTGGSVGSGGLWRGHSDGSPFSALAASTNDNDGYFGTGNDNPSIERRTHTLSNGEVIWDLSGNVWEWNSDQILGRDKPQSSSNEFTSINSYGVLSYDLVRPSNSNWSSIQNMGQYVSGTVTGTTTFAFIRSGRWASTSNAGVFTLDLVVTPGNTSSNLGFRCVVR